MCLSQRLYAACSATYANAVHPNGELSQNAVPTPRPISAIAQAQMDQGADLIYVTASGSGVGVIQAAQETHGAYVIGAFVDLNPFAPDVVITSVERNAKAPLEALLNDIKNGTFTGKDYGFGLANGGTSLSPYHDFDSTIPADVKDKVKAFQDNVIAGSGAYRVPFVTAKLGGETGCEAPVPAAN